MAKVFTIVFILGCFFFKDAAVMFFPQEYLAYSAEDATKTDSSDTKEKDGEEKKDEFKIGLKADQPLLHCGDKKNYYFAHKLNYAQHCVEINSPPPDLI